MKIGFMTFFSLFLFDNLFVFSLLPAKAKYCSLSLSSNKLSTQIKRTKGRKEKIYRLHILSLQNIFLNKSNILFASFIFFIKNFVKNMQQLDIELGTTCINHRALRNVRRSNRKIKK